jgi:hypothetical protein
VSIIAGLWRSETFWIAVGSILQGVGAIIAYSALRYSVTTFTKTLNISNYTELDRMYFDLLQMAVENPRLVDPDATRTGDHEKAYDTYAFMVWNVMESIYDRCHGDDDLCETWYPVIDTEFHRHHRWFDDPRNRPKFKERFRAFIRDRYAKHKHGEPHAAH